MYILPERVPIRGALNFSKNLVFWTNEEGGGLTQSQYDETHKWVPILYFWLKNGLKVSAATI